jgi:hypothetical protein
MTKRKKSWDWLIKEIEEGMERHRHLTGVEKFLDELASVLTIREIASLYIALGNVELRDIMNNCNHLERDGDFTVYLGHILSELKKLDEPAKIKNKDGEVIFTGANPRDTIKDAAEQAVKAGVSLQRANLQGAYLRDANLKGADLRGAVLEDADLSWAILQKANLEDADLTRAKLHCTRLEKANLAGVKLEVFDINWPYLHNAKIQMGNRVFTLKEVGTDA